VARVKEAISRNRNKMLPALVALSVLGGLITSIIEINNATADYFTGCGYGFDSNGTFGYGTGYGYGYGLEGNTYGYGNGNQVCPVLSSSGGGSASGGASTPTTTTTLGSTPGPTTTFNVNPPKHKRVPRLLGLHVYFANWSAVITPHYMKLLNILASEIVADQTSHITITGYASEIGTPGINLPLSLLRAQTVEKYLVQALKARGYTSISYSVSGNGVLRAFANLALDRVVVITG